jgi:RNA polymerase sporulation-specific sigma factor
MADELNMLTDEELVRMAQEGSSTAEEYLIRKYMTLARKKARAYFIAGADSDDVMQEGMIGIFKAIRDFDPEGGASLRTFVELCVNRQIITAVRKANKQGNRILSESISIDEPDAAPMIKDVPDGESVDPAAQAMFQEEVRSLDQGMQKVLSPMEYEVWEYLRQGFSYRQIATLMHKAPKSVDNTIQRIRRKLREQLSE